MKVAMPAATFHRYHYRVTYRTTKKTIAHSSSPFRTRKPLKLSPEARTVVLQHCLHDNTITITLQ